MKIHHKLFLLQAIADKIQQDLILPDATGQSNFVQTGCLACPLTDVNGNLSNRFVETCTDLPDRLVGTAVTDNGSEQFFQVDIRCASTSIDSLRIGLRRR